MKINFMLNTAKHENFPAHNIHNKKSNTLGLFEPEKAIFLDIFYIYEHLKFHAQLS